VTRTLIGAALALLLGALLLFASPWWPWREICGLAGESFPCARPGLFGRDWLDWRGDWVSRWLNGTWLRESALLVWAVGAFALLSAAQRAWDGATRR
jgi:hypothetical protein